MTESTKNTWLFQNKEQKISTLLILFDKNKRLQSCKTFVTLFDMAKYNDVSVKRTTSTCKVEE